MKLKIIDSPIVQPLTVMSRSSGTHISQIISYLCVKHGIYQSLDYNVYDASRMNLMNLGAALERSMVAMMEEHEPERYIQLGELTVGGLIGTPDLLDAQEDRIREIKLTWMSANVDPSDKRFWRYMAQVKSYCHMWGTRIAALDVTFINGTYSRTGNGPEPVRRVYNIEFSQHELLDNWGLMLSNAKNVTPEEH